MRTEVVRCLPNIVPPTKPHEICSFLNFSNCPDYSSDVSPISPGLTNTSPRHFMNTCHPDNRHLDHLTCLRRLIREMTKKK